VISVLRDVVNEDHFLFAKSVDLLTVGVIQRLTLSVSSLTTLESQRVDDVIVTLYQSEFREFSPMLGDHLLHLIIKNFI